MNGFRFELGQSVKDRITGFRGTGQVRYITGCTQVLVTPKAKESGETIDASWYDEDRCELLADVPKIELAITNDGPDAPAPIR